MPSNRKSPDGRARGPSIPHSWAGPMADRTAKSGSRLPQGMVLPGIVTDTGRREDRRRA